MDNKVLCIRYITKEYSVLIYILSRTIYKKPNNYLLCAENYDL